jgi:hypothetical protein
MATSNARTPSEQAAWNEGFNVALELAAKRLELLRAVEVVRDLMLSDGPTREQIDAMLGCSEGSGNAVD